ncbi:MAG: hypothetical protein IT258_24290 [Saprospiraceae bacterium]|nr:hypothetical protein [Saprospiraceae bacterium]
MSKKNNLSVRPVRRNSKPGYPSWQEPNPLEQPYAQPYPFTQKALNWLAASGLCGALFFVQEAEGGELEIYEVLDKAKVDEIADYFTKEAPSARHLPRRILGKSIRMGN